MRILRIMLIWILANSFVTAFSQVTFHEPGKVKIINDPKLDELLNKYLYYCQNYHSIPGYRIQIFFDSGNNSKKGAMNIKASFVTKYPNVEAYIIFQEPYYKVRVGDFRTKMEAEGFLEQIIDEYPNAYRVNDKISFPEIR